MTPHDKLKHLIESGGYSVHKLADLLDIEHVEFQTALGRSWSTGPGLTSQQISRINFLYAIAFEKKRAKRGSASRE